MRRLCDLFARGGWGEVLWHKLFSVSRNLSVNIYKIFLKYVPQSWKSIGNTRHARHMMLQAARGRGGICCRTSNGSYQGMRMEEGQGEGKAEWTQHWRANPFTFIRQLCDTCVIQVCQTPPHPTSHIPHGIGRLFGQSIKQVAEIPLTPLTAPCCGPAWPGKNMSAAGEKHSN